MKLFQYYALQGLQGRNREETGSNQISWETRFFVGFKKYKKKSAELVGSIQMKQWLLSKGCCKFTVFLLRIPSWWYEGNQVSLSNLYESRLNLHCLIFCLISSMFSFHIHVCFFCMPACVCMRWLCASTQNDCAVFIRANFSSSGVTEGLCLITAGIVLVFFIWDCLYIR